MRTIITMAFIFLLWMIFMQLNTFLSPYAEALLEALPSFPGRGLLNLVLGLLWMIFLLFLSFIPIGGAYWLFLDAYERITGKRF